jgi:hypothetical protein
MFINDTLAYYVQYDRFNYDETHLIELDKNFSLWRKGLRFYHNFYRHSANSLPFYGNFPEDAGLLSSQNLREGANTIVLKVYDYAGNFCQIEAPVIYQQELNFQLRQTSHAAFSPAFPLALNFFGGDASVKINAMSFNPEWPGDPSLFLQYYQPGKILMAFPVNSAKSLTTPFGSEFDTLLAKQLSEWVQVLPGKEGRRRSADQLFKIYFPSNAIYDTLHVRIRGDAPPGKLSPPYQYLSKIYDAEPTDQPLNHGAYVTLTLADSMVNKKGAGLYYFDRNKGWKFLPAELEKSSNSFSARVTSLEKFTIIQDTVPPRIIPVNLEKFNAATARYPALQFSVVDDFSGIYREQQIRVDINDRWSLFEFDPEEDLVIIPSKYIPAGSHNIQITVKDNAGNTTVNKFEVNRK